MAVKRMFDREVISQNCFFNLSLESIAMYFLLGLEADDDGFITPKRIMSLYGGTKENLEELVKNNLIFSFPNNVIVIIDWHNNNWLDGRRYKPTLYQDELNQLYLNEDTKKYDLRSNVNQPLSDGLASKEEKRRGKKSVEEKREEEHIVGLKPDKELDEGFLDWNFN